LLLSFLEVLLVYLVNLVEVASYLVAEQNQLVLRSAKLRFDVLYVREVGGDCLL